VGKQYDARRQQDRGSESVFTYFFKKVVLKFAHFKFYSYLCTMKKNNIIKDVMQMAVVVLIIVATFYAYVGFILLVD
jgi:hypothetical protein